MNSQKLIEELVLLIEKQGGLLRIKVSPNSQKTELTEIMADNTVKIRLHAAPEKGKANKELLNYLSKALHVKTDQIKIISGHTDPLKLLRIHTHAA